MFGVAHPPLKTRRRERSLRRSRRGRNGAAAAFDVGGFLHTTWGTFAAEWRQKRFGLSPPDSRMWSVATAVDRRAQRAMWASLSLARDLASYRRITSLPLTGRARSSTLKPFPSFRLDVSPAQLSVWFVP